MAIEITSGDILTPEQLTKHLKIYAGPGAGKTHFLVENMKNIITNNPLIAQGRLRKVLCITYTNAAVDEIKRRLDKHGDYVETHTIHGFIIEHIIHPFQHDLKRLMESDFGIVVDGKGAISSQVEGLGILHGLEKDEIYDFIKETNPSFANDAFGYSKKVMGDVEIDNGAFVSSVSAEVPSRILKNPVGKVNENHIKPLKKYIWSVVRKLTHNEILYFGYRILESNPTALYAMRVKFPYIFVDEFQDTSPLQTLLVKFIGEKSTVVGVVGDIAQSIYSFQGAKPTDFYNFTIDGDRGLSEYVINGNRRSIENVVNFCNFLRQSDSSVTQSSIRPYNSENEKNESESKKIHILLGNSPAVQEEINKIIGSDAVVLTRSWAAAFDYMRDIDSAQAKLLKTIYNSYYASPIQLRDEIAEHNNVTWVRAFRFIFNLWEGYNSGSFIDIVQALKLYIDIEVEKITPKVIFQFKNLSEEVFANVNSQQRFVCGIINRFNECLDKTDFIYLKESIFDADFAIPIFTEFDNDRLKKAVGDLNWDTAYKLFTEVFSENSKYMTVHQSKGLEWDSVVVSVTPNQFDKISLSNLFSNPQLTNEGSADEFTRMYYVACSRSKEDLYIHIASGPTANTIENSIKSFSSGSQKTINYEIIT